MRLKGNSRVFAIVIALAIALTVSIAAQAPQGAPPAGGRASTSRRSPGGATWRRPVLAAVSGVDAAAEEVAGPGSDNLDEHIVDGWAGENSREANAQAGQSIPPALSWTNVPIWETVPMFVLIMNDPETCGVRRGYRDRRTSITGYGRKRFPATVTSMPEGPLAWRSTPASRRMHDRIAQI
jgi:hypothetical protein